MIKSKRGRKPKNKLLEIQDISNGSISNESISNKSISTNHINNLVTDISNTLIPKKRGRKPKGGKILQNLSTTTKIVSIVPNIILHLNCTLLDINIFLKSNNIYTPEISDIKTYDETDNKIFTPKYELLNGTDSTNIDSINIDSTNIDSINIDSTNVNNTFFNDIKNSSHNHNKLNNISNMINRDNIIENKKSLSKIINEKLIELSHKLHNNISEGKSACFWCTYNFDTPNIYIPKTMCNDNINVYGCFCSPECATAYLMNENIDISTKYERYYLLNNVYDKIYNYTKLIKPAPNPHYSLDKFCGNLTIDEYRNLFNEDNLIIIVNKPLTCVYPELFKDNNNSSSISNIMNNNTYNINRYN